MMTRRPLTRRFPLPGLCLLLAGLAGGSLQSAAPRQAPPEAISAKSLRALRTREPIRLDGRLDEAIWAQAPAATDFTVSWPELGKASQRPTSVKVLYDDHHLYVGARLGMAPGQQPKALVHRRDQDTNSDWFGVFLDSLHDRRTAFAFLVNAAGVQQDRVYYYDTNWDSSWDGVWESAVARGPEGWSVELKIPLSLLRLSNGKAEQVWGVNFARYDQLPSQENAYWHAVPRDVNAFVSAFPTLTGIEGVKPQLRREWLPYVSAQRKFETTQPYDDREWTRRAGLDAHLGLSASSQLDLTLRPDFGQVEVDQAVLNLGTYETYLPEKRPFFLEGMEIFQFTGPQLFYSRRIGRGLDEPDLAEGERLKDRPMSAEILGAAKYTAKLEGGTNLGFLAANVEAARATVADATGRETRREVNPMGNAGVLRATQALDERGSFVGVFGSWLREAGPSGRDAKVGGVDAILRSADRKEQLELSVARTLTGIRQGGARSGDYGRIQLGHNWGEGWSFWTSLVNAGRDFNPNDLGYYSRADKQQVATNLGRRWDQPLGPLRNRQWQVNAGWSRDQAGAVFERWLETYYRTEWSNGWATLLGTGGSFAVQEDRELRTYRDPVKKYLDVPSHPWLFCYVDTPGHAPWVLSLHQTWDRYREGQASNTYLGQSIRPTSRMEFRLETTYIRSNGQQRYVETQGDTPIVGTRRLSELDQLLRVSYAFTPDFTMQLFSQWMDASWCFDDLKRYVDDHHLAPGAAPSDPSALASSERLWNLNLIARWEFRPGSTFYFVYTHGVYTDALASDNASVRPRRDLMLLRHLPSDDVVQVKLSWLFR